MSAKRKRTSYRETNQQNTHKKKKVMVVEKRNDVIYSSGTRICETTQFPFPPSVDHVCVMSPHTSSRWALQSRWNLETSDTGWIVSNVIQIKTVAVCMELCKHKKHYLKKRLLRKRSSRQADIYLPTPKTCLSARMHLTTSCSRDQYEPSQTEKNGKGQR